MSKGGFHCQSDVMKVSVMVFAIKVIYFYPETWPVIAKWPIIAEIPVAITLSIHLSIDHIYEDKFCFSVRFLQLVLSNPILREMLFFVAQNFKVLLRNLLSIPFRLSLCQHITSLQYWTPEIQKKFEVIIYLLII